MKSNELITTFDYELLPATGPYNIPSKGNVVELLFEIPYLFTFDLIPNLDVINSILATGNLDAGMSGGAEWKPFKIDDEAFNTLLSLLMDKEPRLEYIEQPEWVVDYNSFSIWKMYVKKGIPWQYHLQQSNKVEALRKQWLKAIEAGDEETAQELNFEMVDEGTKLSTWMMKLS